MPSVNSIAKTNVVRIASMVKVTARQAPATLARYSGAVQRHLPHLLKFRQRF